MASKLPKTLPDAASVVHVDYRVPFFDTDAMGIVHHANFVRYLELGRVRWLSVHDRPYTEYIERGLHVAVTGVQTRYQSPGRFDEALTISAWLSWARSASLGFSYLIRRGDTVLVSAWTDHAVVNDAGRPTRMPAEFRARIQPLVFVEPG